MIKNKNILIVSAHLDDEVYGLGGSIAVLSKNNNVKIVTFCHGLGFQDEDRITRYFNNLDSLKIDGIVDGYDDLSLHKYSHIELSKDLESSIDEIPDIIFTHTPKHTHSDHKIISEIVDVYARNKPISVFHFSIPGNTEFSNNDFQNELFIDITNEIKTKKKMVKSYKEYPKNHPLNWKNIKAKDKYNGSLIGVKYAETFEVKRMING